MKRWSPSRRIFEARGDERGGDVVNAHAFARAGAAQERHCPINRFAHRQAAADDCASRRQSGSCAGGGFNHVTPEAREDGGLVRCARSLGCQRDRGALSEHMNAHPETRRRRLEEVRFVPGCLRLWIGLFARRGQSDREHGHQPLLAFHPVRRRKRAARVRGLPRRIPECAHEIRAVARPFFRVLRHHPANEEIERGRRFRAQLRGARRVLQQDLGENRHHVEADEEGATGEALEEHAPEREDVGRGSDPAIPSRLLRRDEARRSDDHIRLRSQARGDARAGHAEIDDPDGLDLPVHQEDVARLEVPVDEALAMQALQSRRHAARERDGLFDRERSVEEASLEVHPIEPRHDEEGISLARDAVADVADNVRVIDLREELHLLREAIRRALIALAEHL